MGTRHLLLLLPFTSTPRKPSLPPLENPNTPKWRRSGLRNARGPASTGPEFGYGPEDGYRYFEWPASDSSGSSSSSKQRTWWSDEADYDDDDSDEDNYSYDWKFRNEADGFHIFSKVIRAFGWMLPAIAMWLVFGTDVRADTNSFLMALAVPLGQTALSLVIDKVWANADASSPPGRGRGRHRNKTRKKPFARAAGGRKRSGVKQETKNGERIGSYQSWMATGDGSFKEKGDKRPGNYGGWDELDSVS